MAKSALISTEIGAFPGSWQVQRFDSLFAVQQGRQASKNNRVGDNQHPFLRTRNVFWGRLNLSDLDEMHFSEADESRLALEPGDMLVCEGGDIGRTAIWQGVPGRRQDETGNVMRRRCEAVRKNIIKEIIAVEWSYFKDMIRTFQWKVV
jgi:hypothetical protein